MPTDERLSEYIAGLPPIYREILSSFLSLNPRGQHGEQVLFGSIEADFRNRGVAFGIREIVLAVQNLERAGLVEIRNRMWVKPTEKGRRLIGLIGAERAAFASNPLPPLPQ